MVLENSFQENRHKSSEYENLLMCYQNVVFGRVARTNINLVLLPYSFNFSEVYMMAALEQNNK
jgi:hypothetical protein